MKIFIDQISDIVKDVFEELGYDRESGKVTVSNRPDLCQYQCNGALPNAKKHGKAPRVIAEEVVAKLQENKIFSWSRPRLNRVLTLSTLIPSAAAISLPDCSR